MAGPVLSLELLRGSRRGRQHVFRGVYGGLLLAEFAVFALLYLMRATGKDVFGPPGWLGDPSPLGALIGWFLAVLAVQQFLVLVLAVPAFTAGAVTEEKARGTLQGLLTTELTPLEIVSGKLIGQLVRVLDLSLPGWLLLGAVAGLGGLGPAQLLALVSGLLAPLPALGAAGLLASVWCRRTTNAAVAVYGTAAVGGAMLWVFGRITTPTGPFHFLRLVSDNPGPTPVLSDLLMCWLAWGGLALPLLALAAWQLRPAYRRQLTARARRGGWALRRPPVGDHPVRWKEQYVERVLDLPGLRLVPRPLGVAAVFALSCACSLAILLAHLPAGPARVLDLVLRLDLPGLENLLARGKPAGTAFALQGLAVMALAGLAAGARTSSAVCGERERQTWEALLLTPLTTKQLLRSKLWGTLNVFRPYLLAYTVPAVVVSLLAGLWPLVWTVTFWVLTWVMMYYMAACGIACSVRAPSTWRGWLSTMLTGYRGVLGQLLFVALPCGVFAGSLLHGLLLAGLLQQYRPSSPGAFVLVASLLAPTLFPGTMAWLTALFTAVLLFARAEQQLVEAEKRLAQTDRIPQRLRVRPAVVPTA
jgi:ABC-type transport system involved in multi-copper enzyme maturation permease subunit